MGAPSRKVGEEGAVSRKKVVVKVVGRRRRSIPEIFPPRKACPGGRRFGRGATVVSGVHGRETAGSGGTEGLGGVGDKERRNEVK